LFITFEIAHKLGLRKSFSIIIVLSSEHWASHKNTLGCNNYCTPVLNMGPLLLLMSAAWPRGLQHRFTVTVWSWLAWSRFNSTVVAHIVASLDEALYDDYICFVASIKQ